MTTPEDKLRINSLCERIESAHGTERVRQHLKDGRFQNSDEVHVRSWLRSRDLPRAFARIIPGVLALIAAAAAVGSCMKA
jgi:hypothetical protein